MLGCWNSLTCLAHKIKCNFAVSGTFRPSFAEFEMQVVIDSHPGLNFYCRHDR